MLRQQLLFAFIFFHDLFDLEKNRAVFAISFYLVAVKNQSQMKYTQFRVRRKKGFSLLDHSTRYDEEFISQEKATEKLKLNVRKLSKIHDKIWAEDKHAVLVIFQSMDAAGKDGAIRHVMSGFKPQGTKVYNFDKPTYAEYDHDYLWRTSLQLPRRGHIGIFNRSYYEEVLVARVHDLLKMQRIPEYLIDENIWHKRYRQMRNYERHLYENGMIIIKIFLHVSKEEQKVRLMRRIDDKTKNWKFSHADVRDRQHWDLYQQYYDECIRETAAKHAPWFIVPADDKKIARYIVSEIMLKSLHKYDFKMPEMNAEQQAKLEACRKSLLNSDSC
jgi:PPK2 family polyphosphate:nucleotide phosphotransferase